MTEGLEVNTAPKQDPAVKIFKIALVGNPNCGKSTLFNVLTGLNQKVGNYPGVTVEKKSGYFFLSDGTKAEITDLPGIYSLNPKSADESVARDVLCDTHNPAHPDLIIIVADATNLKRSLVLATQIIDLGKPCIMALNIIDLATKDGLQIDIPFLEEKMGIKIIPISARNNEGIDTLRKALLKSIKKPEVSFIDPLTIFPKFPDAKKKVTGNYYSDYHAFQLITTETFIRKNGELSLNSIQSEETIQRYKQISLLIKSAVKKEVTETKETFTSKTDKILVHKTWGLLIFMVIMFTIFQAIFNFSLYPMQFIEWGFQQVSILLINALPEGLFRSLITDGVLAGLSGIMIFIPQIAFLFGFIAIMEDTGYMARVSFMMDRVMHRFGLNGRSVIPLMSGAACAVPAILSARTIGNRKERLITIFVVPLISCSARIPVYILLISMLVPSKMFLGFFNYQGLTLLGLYMLGFIAAISTAYLMKIIFKTKERSFFIMELPVYRTPRWKSIGITIWDKIKTFVSEAGKIIIAISIILWALSSFAPGNAFEQIEDKYSSVDMDSETKEILIASEKLQNSYAGRFGKTIEPVIAPLGFDWKIGIALLTSFAAREVFVGTMATIYSVENPENTNTLRSKMVADKNSANGNFVYTPATIISLLIFFAFAMQCMSTVAVTWKETDHWKWPAMQFLYMTALAYLCSWIAYNFLR
jgi:ferrous iron transport protein B